MSSSPRSRTSQTAIFALAVGAAIIGLSLILVGLGVNVLEAGEIFVGGLFPPVAVTTEGAQIRDLYTIVFLIAVAIFIVVEGLIIWSVIRYRRKPGDDTLPPQTHGNNIAEFVWTIVPTILVIFMFVISWQTLNQVDKSSADAQTKIRAVAGQFQWTFDYLAPDGTTILYTEFIPLASQGGGMNVPAGRTVQLSLVSNDVIHAFYVPQFLFKRDVVPGRTNQFDFTVNESDVGPDVPRAMRGAVRQRAQHHAVRGQGACPPPTSTRGCWRSRNRPRAPRRLPVDSRARARGPRARR